MGMGVDLSVDLCAQVCVCVSASGRGRQDWGSGGWREEWDRRGATTSERYRGISWNWAEKKQVYCVLVESLVHTDKHNLSTFQQSKPTAYPNNWNGEIWKRQNFLAVSFCSFSNTNDTRFLIWKCLYKTQITDSKCHVFQLKIYRCRDVIMTGWQIPGLWLVCNSLKCCCINHRLL